MLIIRIVLLLELTLPSEENKKHQSLEAPFKTIDVYKPTIVLTVLALSLNV